MVPTFFSQEFLHNTLRNCQNQNYFVHIFTSNKKSGIVCLYCVVNNLTHGWTIDFNLLGLTIGFWAEGWCSQIGYRCEQGCVTSKKFWILWYNILVSSVCEKNLDALVRRSNQDAFWPSCFMHVQLPYILRMDFFLLCHDLTPHCDFLNQSWNSCITNSAMHICSKIPILFCYADAC